MVGHPSQQGSLISEPTTVTEIHKESSVRVRVRVGVRVRVRVR